LQQANMIPLGTPPAAAEAAPAASAPRAELDQLVDTAQRVAHALEHILTAARAYQPSDGRARPPADLERARWGASLRTMFEAGVGKMIRRETGRIRRCREAAPLRALMKDYYLQHAEVYLEEILPSVRAHAVLMGDATDPRTLAHRFVEGEIETSRRELEAIAAGPLEQFASALELLCVRWERTRAAGAADALMMAEFATAAAGIPVVAPPVAEPPAVVAPRRVVMKTVIRGEDNLIIGVREEEIDGGDTGGGQRAPLPLL
jgi:hypothetical protein